MYLRILLLALLTVGADSRPPDTDRIGSWEKRMFEAVNAERASRGLPPYRQNRRLEEAAEQHTRRMIAASDLSHQLPGEPAMRSRIASTGLRFDAVAENVAYSTRVEEIHDDLMGSPGHRQNLLSRQYDSIGIAILQSGDRYYVTQDFAHTTSEASAPEAEDDFVDAVNALRRGRGLTPARVATSGAMRDAACEMARRDQVDAGLVPHEQGFRHFVAFNTFEPGQLTAVGREIATNRGVERLAIGVCHRSTRRYPSGVFWFAVAY
jgi:uncharacterized protein YkwD